MTIEVRNARVTAVSLDIERGLTAWLTLDYGGSGQGFGGFMLYSNSGWSRDNKYNYNFAGRFISRCIEICGVQKWEQIPGKTVRVRSDWTKVYAIGHILKDDWFDPTADFREYNP